MRKILRIIFIVLLAAYFLRVIIKFQIDNYWIEGVLALFLIPYFVYEMVQLRNDDRINNTHTFRNRILMMIIGALFLILSAIIMNMYYEP